MTFFRKMSLMIGAAAAGFAAWPSQPAMADDVECPVTYGALKSALTTAASQDSTGLNNNFWGVVVNRKGQVCAVAYTGRDRDSQWLLSRQIAAAKAFTANGLSLTGFPISTAQLYPWVQPSPSGGNPLFGLGGGNVLDSNAAYDDPYSDYGTTKDPMIGRRVGGTITFGGGLSLYQGTRPVGAVGLSGDTACADHSTAWRTRILLRLVPSAGNDRLTFSDTAGHPHCPNDGATQGVNTPAAPAT